MCVFCKIIAGDIPVHKIYEDEKIFVFLDINPVHPGHILVLPKQHFQDMEEITTEDLTAVISGVKKFGGLLKERMGYEAYNVHQNNGSVAGQTVPHLHFHLIPRLPNDNLNHWPAGKYSPGEAEKICRQLQL